MIHLTVICVVPQDLIAQIKEEDSLHGLDQERDMQFSVLYTSNPKLVQSFQEIPERTMAILYLPHEAETSYKKSANALIGKFSTNNGFYLITDKPTEVNIRVYKKESHIGINRYLEVVARTNAISSQLVAA